MANVVAIQKPIAEIPNTSSASSLIYMPYASLVKDADFVYLATGTAATGFFLLGGNFMPGDTITYTVNGITRPALAVTSNMQAIQALVTDINNNTNTELVMAASNGINNAGQNLVIVTANTPGTGGNSIALTISTTSATGEVARSGATLVGGSTLGPASSVMSAPSNIATGLVGIAQCASTQTWSGAGGNNPGFTPSPGYSMGYSILGTGLFSGVPGQLPIIPLGAPTRVTGNLTQTTGWQSGGAQQATYGTQVGLGIDPVTGFYVFDPTLSNKVAIVNDISASVNNAINSSIAGNNYSANPVGLLGARVHVTFINSALQVQQGD